MRKKHKFILKMPKEKCENTIPKMKEQQIDWYPIAQRLS